MRLNGLEKSHRVSNLRPPGLYCRVLNITLPPATPRSLKVDSFICIIAYVYEVDDLGCLRNVNLFSAPNTDRTRRRTQLLSD
jgi:hypothetical protein